MLVAFTMAFTTCFLLGWKNSILSVFSVSVAQMGQHGRVKASQVLILCGWFKAFLTTVPLTCCVTLGKSFNSNVPQFPFC